MAEALEGFWLKRSAGITSKIGPLTHKQLLGSSLEHSKFLFIWPILLLAYWKWHTTSIRQGASQTTNNNPSEKFLNQPGLSSGYLQTHFVAKSILSGCVQAYVTGCSGISKFLTNFCQTWYTGEHLYQSGYWQVPLFCNSPEKVKKE